jgi:hypothetical protein
MSERTTIRTGGFSTAIMIGVGILGGFSIVLGIQEGVTLVGALGVVLGVWFIVYSLFYVIGNSLAIDENNIVYRSAMGGRGIFPRRQEFTIAVADVRRVILAQTKYFDEHKDELNDDFLNVVIHHAKRMAAPTVVSRGIPMVIPLWIAAKHTPLLYIKGLKKSLVVNTKPFSRSGFRRFIATCEKKGIRVEIIDSVL